MKQPNFSATKRRALIRLGLGLILILLIILSVTMAMKKNRKYSDLGVEDLCPSQSGRTCIRPPRGHR